MPLEKHPADYLVHRYYPEYRGAFHGEFPHIAICDRHHHDTIITRTYHSPDRFPEAWNTACHQADQLNNQSSIVNRKSPCPPAPEPTGKA